MAANQNTLVRFPTSTHYKMAAAGRVGAVFFLCIAACTGAHETSSTEEFDVKPGGQEYTNTRRLKWQMSIGVDKDNTHFSCSIWRPTGVSYLFFTMFKVEVTGGKIEFCEAYSQADKPLKKSEYLVSSTTVSDRPGSFSSSLYKLTVVASSSHEEL
ncbi:myeloid-derived growth factor [Pseudophryne corroboree]|uniref:myeloid-derived growth factor n=1 Tax=Pseudophryne corroboree TaxID=495146 RepID=UPI0030819E65